jgi:hypothetical protein
MLHFRPFIIAGVIKQFFHELVCDIELLGIDSPVTSSSKNKFEGILPIK